MSTLAATAGARVPHPPPPRPGAFDSVKVGAGWALSNGNRTGFNTNQGPPNQVGANLILRSLNACEGKRYFEFVWGVSSSDSGDSLMTGVCWDSHSIIFTTSEVGAWEYEGRPGQVLGTPTEGNYISFQTYTTYVLATIGIALDAATGKLWFSKNGVWFGDPAAGTDWAVAVGLDSPLHAGVWADNVNSGAPRVVCAGTGNFTADTQVYSAPVGFLPWDA